MTYTKDFSIIVPVWRGAIKFLPKLFDSIPERDGIEIIVVDNSKEPVSREEIKSDRNIIFLHSAPERHAGGSRNDGMDVAKGKWLLFADADDGIERGKRILEDHADFVAADLVELFFGDLEEILAAIEDGSAFDDGVGRQDTHDGLGGNRFAGSGFPDDAKGLAFIEVKGDAADGLDDAMVRLEGNREVIDLDYLFFFFSHYCSPPFKVGLSASRRPFPKRLNEIINKEMMMAGQMTSIGRLERLAWLSARRTPKESVP